MRIVLPAVLLLAAACGDDATSGADAGSTVDAGSPAPDATASGPLPTTCAGDCGAMSLHVEFGATSRSFDRAFFGLTSPANSDSGEWEIYIENNSGSDAECPTESSPTPLFLLTLAGFRVPTDISDASATATLVDFEGALLDEVVEPASTNTVHWSAADLCLACAEGSEPNRPGRMVAFQLDATFAQGTITGHSYATHCESLDKL